MATVNFKRFAANVLADYISANIPGLAGKVSAVAAGPEANAPCLALKILPEQFAFEESEGDEVYEATSDDGKVIVEIGLFSGNFTLELFAASPAERELYEQKILDLFMAQVWAPGTLYLTMPNVVVNGYASLYSAEFKAFLQTDNWTDEFAFESKRFSFLQIAIEFPALTTYNAANLASLQLAFTDMDHLVVTVADVNASDRYEIQQDGSTIPATV